MFSKTCEYGIKAVLYIASQSLENKRVKIGDIVQNIDSPEAFTSKILGVLSKSEIISSQTGPNGGYEVKEENIHSVTIAEIIKAIEGNDFFDGCVLGLSHCNPNEPCPMHNTVDPIRSRMKKVLQNTTIYDLAKRVENKESTLVR